MTTSILKARNTFLCDKTSEGWTLVKDGAFQNFDTKIIITEWPSIEYPRNYDHDQIEVINGKAESFGQPACQQYAERIIFQPEILSDMKSNNILFMGTVWKDKFGDLHVPCLHKEYTCMCHFNWVLTFPRIKDIYYCCGERYSFATIE